MCDRASDPSQYDIPQCVADGSHSDDLTHANELRTGTGRHDIYGTGQGIVRGSQVVVAGEGMGTVINTECVQGVHNNVYAINIEGDPGIKITCYPRELVTLYADIYAETDSDHETRLIAEGDAITEAYYEQENINV